MRIVFVTTLSLEGSTMNGRILPLAHEFSQTHDVHILGFSPAQNIEKVAYHNVGREPFTRSSSGKKRLGGIKLIISMLRSALMITSGLWRLKPDVVIVSKTLPHNVLGVRLWRLFHRSQKVIIDVDDFELMANHLTSLTQRLSIHWAERSAVKMAGCVIAASPFLLDHFQNLRPGIKTGLIPTGIHPVTINDGSRPADTVAYFGSVSITSGHRVDLLPDILRLIKEKLPSVKLIIAGSGDDITLLRKQFAAKGLSSSVQWHGRFATSGLSKLITGTGVLIDPIDASIPNRAKSSFRVALAAITGTPVVSSNVGIRPRLLPRPLHKRFFAAPANAQDYADKIIDLLLHPISLHDSKLMRATGRSYLWPHLAKDYLKKIVQC